MAEGDSTVANVRGGRPHRLSRGASRAFIVVLALLCAAGVTGLLGGRTATATTSAHGFRLTLAYPVTTRPGLDTLWQLRVVHVGGFHGPLTVAVSSSYLGLFETQGWYPTPSATSADGHLVYMTFTPPPHGDAMTVRFDSYLQPYVAPSRLFANRAMVAVIQHHRERATIPFTTWVIP